MEIILIVFVTIIILAVLLLLFPITRQEAIPMSTEGYRNATFNGSLAAKNNAKRPVRWSDGSLSSHERFASTPKRRFLKNTDLSEDSEPWPHFQRRPPRAASRMAVDSSVVPEGETLISRSPYSAFRRNQSFENMATAFSSSADSSDFSAEPTILSAAHPFWASKQHERPQMSVNQPQPRPKQHFHVDARIFGDFQKSRRTKYGTDPLYPDRKSLILNTKMTTGDVEQLIFDEFFQYNPVLQIISLTLKWHYENRGEMALQLSGPNMISAPVGKLRSALDEIAALGLDAAPRLLVLVHERFKHDAMIRPMPSSAALSDLSSDTSKDTSSIHLRVERRFAALTQDAELPSKEWQIPRKLEGGYDAAVADANPWMEQLAVQQLETLGSVIKNLKAAEEEQSFGQEKKTKTGSKKRSTHLRNTTPAFNTNAKRLGSISAIPKPELVSHNQTDFSYRAAHLASCLECQQEEAQENGRRTRRSSSMPVSYYSSDDDEKYCVPPSPGTGQGWWTDVRNVERPPTGKKQPASSKDNYHRRSASSSARRESNERSTGSKKDKKPWSLFGRGKSSSHEKKNKSSAGGGGSSRSSSRRDGSAREGRSRAKEVHWADSDYEF